MNNLGIQSLLHQPYPTNNIGVAAPFAVQPNLQYPTNNIGVAVPFAVQSNPQYPTNNISVAVPFGVNPMLTNTVNMKDYMIKPEELMTHVRNISYIKDVIDESTDDGLIKLRINDPEFRRANGGIITFLNKSDSSYNQTVGMVNKLQKTLTNSYKDGKLNFNIPLGVVDTNHCDNDPLCTYFKVKTYPTFVYQTQDGNYHQFNGPKGLNAALKQYLHDHSRQGEGNVLNFEEFTFEDRSPLKGSLVNINLST